MKPNHETRIQAGAIILAGGEGSRLATFTSRINGQVAPKYFCSILGEETLLEQTGRRVSLSISPERTMIVLARAHERFYTPLTWGASPDGLAIQPMSRGTAVAILFGLLRLIYSARINAVAIFPSDHYVSDDRKFMRHVEGALSAVWSSSAKVVLLGIPADRPESDYGWVERGDQIIRAGDDLEPIFRIRRVLGKTCTVSRSRSVVARPALEQFRYGSPG